MAVTECVEFQAPETPERVSVNRSALSPVSNGLERETDTNVEENEDDSWKPVLHVEARLKETSYARADILQQLLHAYIHNNFVTLPPNSDLPDDWRNIDALEANIELVRIAESNLLEDVLSLDDVQLEIHLYQPSHNAQSQEFGLSGGEEENQSSAAAITDLPSALLDGLWHNLIYETGIKENLLNYIYSTILFSDAGIDFDIISYNRVVLLHGPPGTGKTSLCRALAQKLSIRLASRYRQGKLVEINGDSRNWFSESAQLVAKLFASILDLADDQDTFIVVLIDEVESLTSARKGGTEPTDALRVVNALLTQLDKLKTRKNVLVVTTSNLSHAIDSAFVDRADIKQYIGLPPPQAIYWILASGMTELMNKGLVGQCKLLDWKAAKLLDDYAASSPLPVAKSESPLKKKRKTAGNPSLTLYRLAKSCRDMGMSGRSLRRLAVLAHARHLGTAQSDIMQWLTAMQRVTIEEAQQMQQVQDGGI